MTKYIDAEKLKRDLIDNRSFFPAIVARAIEDMPAADVVSKVEYDDLYTKYCELARLLNDECPKIMDMVKTLKNEN